MGQPSPRDVTTLLRLAGAGNDDAAEDLMPLVYDELHRLADRSMRRERDGHTLQATALVHEAYLRLVDQRQVQWADRAHFFAIAATSMRRILTDHARRRCAARRGGGAQHVPVEDIEDMASRAPEQLLTIDDALARLAALDPRKGRVVELRFFAGLDHAQIGEVLGISRATVERDWAAARAWLHREIER